MRKSWNQSTETSLRDAARTNPCFGLQPNIFYGVLFWAIGSKANTILLRETKSLFLVFFAANSIILLQPLQQAFFNGRQVSLPS